MPGPRNPDASQERKESMKKRTLSSRAGLQFPVGRVHRKLKQGNYGERISVGAAVYLAGIMEYLSAEVLELAGNAARDNKKARIVPRHITLAVKNDDELNTFLGGVTISEGGVIPNIEKVLLPVKTTKNQSDKENMSRNNIQSQDY
ncbi:histone H2A, sperm-like [Culicoides brevitarsis]|uniref:histone H2A, sperm-like n=1 Tax=Culicoides brevitarsis TaxID=469753 RepID=UPI00307CBE4B